MINPAPAPGDIQRLSLVTDAWHPQVNGVVTTLSQLVDQLQRQQIEVDVIHPNDYQSVPLPTYPEIPLVWRAKGLRKRLLDFKPNAIHIATEGLLGWKARRIALQHRLPFTTAYHTKYPEYIHERFPIPQRWIYALMRRFHRPAHHTFVPGESILQELQLQNFQHLVLMTRGVNTDIFHPNAATQSDASKPPVYLYVGRIAPEKNLSAFLDLNLPGHKVVVGKGPDLAKLQEAYPEVEFTGPKYDHELAAYYADAKVFVFPSRTDTFGVVNLEAIACGTPVAAFPVTGPKDIITPGLNGILSEDLQAAILEAAKLKPHAQQIAASIPQYTWEGAAQQFIQHLAYIPQSNSPEKAPKQTQNLVR
ncbi:MAG: glycosyltransferase family 4 protein [Hydrogenovibrio sp.]